MLRRTFTAASLAAGVVLAVAPATLAKSDPLSSWNDGAAKRAIVDFVARTKSGGGTDFDPYERADITSNSYDDWLISQPYILMGAQTYVGNFLASFKEYPPSQGPRVPSTRSWTR